MASSGTKQNPIKGNTITVTEKSVAPAIKSFSRNGSTYKLEWTKGATYVAQEVKFRRRVDGVWKAWSPISVTRTATSASKAYSITDYYPTTAVKLNAIEADVRGKEAGALVKSAAYKKNGKYYYDEIVHERAWSGYAYSIFDVSTPAQPTVGAGTVSRSSSTSTSFSYSVSTSDSAKIFARVQYDTALVSNWGDTNPASYTGAWTSAGTNTNTSGTKTISEPSTIHGLAQSASYTRMIRVRSQGPAGDSAYSYNKFVYAWPYKIDASKISVTRTAISGGMRLAVNWTPSRDGKHPATKFKVEYYIGKPANGSMALPSGSISWNPGDSGTTNTSTSFNIAHVLQNDEALWVRVTQVNIDGWLETPSDAKFVAFGGVTHVGASDLSISSYDSATKSLTLNCSNPSQISTSMLWIDVNYWSNGKWNKTSHLEIPHGQNSVTGTLDLNGYAEWRFDTYVGIGGGYWSALIATRYNPRTEATNPYVYVPVNVSAALVKNSAGTAQVKWTNVMGGVTAARITVADNADEWGKANPEFVVDATAEGTNIQSTNIGNLEYGQAYWFRVQTTNSHGTSGYSQAASVTLDASAAPVPVLAATETDDHHIQVTWDWSLWASATAVELSWSDNPQGGDTDYKQNETTIQRSGRSGPYSFTITEGLSRGKMWYIWARFVSDKAVSNPGTASCELPVNPVTPTNITAVREAQATDESGKSTVRVSWDNNWGDADSAVIAWADSESAWEATSGLNTYTLSGAQGRNTTVLIPNLQMGKTWYFKVNLTYNSGAFETSYSSVPFTPLDLTTDPGRPVASLSAPVISELSKADISWTYSCEDGMAQSSVEMLVTDENGDEVVTIGYGGTETSFALYPATYGMVGNQTYNISVRTTSASGRVSEWSEVISLRVIHKPIASITSTSLVNGVLTEFPLTVTVDGLVGNGTTTVYIERAQECFDISPDEDKRGGYEGELIALATARDSGTVSITADDLIGVLNERALFRIVAIVTDSLGASDPATLDFTVDWTHQALIPIVTREVDDDARIVKMTITAPSGSVEGDTVDVYRLSADKPELIIRGAEFGQTYVDPYPAFGETGGHRFVYRTLNNDITTADKRPAWIDLDGSCDASDPEAETDAVIPADRTTINFGNSEIDLLYNLELSHSWGKDFAETKYLGGSVQGDWNPAVSRKASVSSVSITLTDMGTIEKMRRLAIYPGICHIRTPDGSSFPADIQVSEDRSHENGGKIVAFNLDITRVDAETFEGISLAEWEAEDELE